MTAPHDRLCALTDSLPGAIRWRFCDYEQLLTKQLRLLAAPLHLAWPPRDDRDGFRHDGGSVQCGRDGRSSDASPRSGAE